MAKTKSTVSLADIVRGAVGESSIAALDAAASDSDTGRAQITYVPLESLVPDNGNFYSLDGIDELAANIETVGLLDPIIVRPVDGQVSDRQRAPAPRGAEYDRRLRQQGL